ncbi:Tyrosine-protein phosphatase 69D [Araneus ventricosus]|uniref:protein-tyrosine-phosphatase n=1 Tax=Araneus ventricosus TaxID=182803 RepID=A0A4Y2A2H0_ARAVE|nr:Tyrosine-protein phosphatase 69D [Araneus ventricosus]
MVRCYKVVIIKLPKGQNLSKLPENPQSLQLSTHEKVHKAEGQGAYIAEAFTSEDFVSEVVIGDNHQRNCDINPSTSDRKRHIIQDSYANNDMQEIELVQDGILAPSTNYTGYVLIKVQGPNDTILTKTSPYFSPILTGNDLCSPPTPTSTESPILVILGVICGIILVFVALGLALYLLRNKHGPQYLENGERLGLTALILRTINRNGHLPRGGPLSKIPRLGPISAEELPAAFIERHMDSDLLFQSEFEALPDSFKDRTTHASDAPENLNKNRYPDIKAYDQTRVRLPVIDGIPGSDYINANFVEGYKGRKTFICAQGPLDRTVTDFWRMLWEHRVTVVVMLTGIEEHGQVKCAQYWNENSAKEIEKMFVITVLSTKRYSDYIVRRFQVEFTKDGLTEEREVLHFHFVLWKDFLAPEQPSWLLRFIKRVNEHYCSDRGPLLVHCSAGVGRTGTFVAIDSLLQQLEDEGRIDVFAHVSNLRHQRNFLVQSLQGSSVKKNDRSHLSDKKVDIANSLLDVLVFKCTQLTEKALFNAEATLQKNEKNEQNTTFSQFQENFSYSDALRGMRKPHTILVYPAKDSSEATSIEEILKNSIRPKANVKIREFRKVKNQGVAVSCDSVTDIQSIISRLDGDNSAKEKVSHRMPGKRHPSIILYDLPNSITDQEVQEALRTYTEDAENLRTRFKLKGRKPDTSHWVMEAPCKQFLQLKRFRKIAVNWNMFQLRNSST